MSLLYFLTTSKKSSGKYPFSASESLVLQWYQRESSFTEKENIRTFVGYKSSEFKSVISIVNGLISRSVFTEKGEVQIQTSKNGFLTIQKEESSHKCGLCCGAEHHQSQNLFRKLPSTRKNTANTTANRDKIIPDDNVLRTFRLALPMTPGYFNGFFQNDVTKVKAFWAKTEVGINEFYMRDIGVRFEVINDEKLIIRQKGIVDLDKTGYRSIINFATRQINDLIGADNYDLGVLLSQSTSPGNGYAFVSFGYLKQNKASAMVANTELHTIVHEMGHLLGASHVFAETSRDWGYSHKTETGFGQSVMTYGVPKTFFSLVSLADIRKELYGLPYYTDATKTKQAGKKTIPNDYDNFPIGKKTTSKAPKIDDNSVKETYEIPSSTYFAFKIKASHPDKNKLLYMAHPADKAVNGVSRAKFITQKPSENNRIAFQDIYGIDKRLTEFSTSANQQFTFWVAASTGKDAHLRPDEVVRYDVRSSKVKVVDAKPFRITSELGILRHAGERFTLKWDVDPKLFQNTRVKISLSDDFGKTFKYTLTESTENDGEHEIVFPNTQFRSTYYETGKRRVRAGVIKVEVIDHIAYALSVISPWNGGGFELDPNSEITFTDVPNHKIVLPHGSEVPVKHDVKATTKCRRGLENISYQEEILENTSQYSKIVTRRWTAKDKCKKESTFVQVICVEKQEEPFKEEPEDDSQDEKTSTESGNTKSQDEKTSPESGNTKSQD